MPLTVTNLTYTYNAGLPSARAALSGVSFKAERSAIVSILGHTGSGKSTLAQHLNGLITPQSGSVSADGVESSGASASRELRRKVGLVFQYPEEQIFSESVYDEIAFAPRNWGVAEANIEERVRWAASAAGIGADMLSASPYSLSGGQKRSVAIASVVSARPDYLVLDEPTAGLDFSAAASFTKMIKNFAAGGAGIILITHDVDLALCVSARILVLEDGRVVSWGTPEETAEFVAATNIKGLAAPEILCVASALRRAGKIERLAWTAEGLLSELRKRKNAVAR